MYQVPEHKTCFFSLEKYKKMANKDRTTEAINFRMTKQQKGHYKFPWWDINIMYTVRLPFY